MESKARVLIVGAGPAGLSMAIELQKRAIPIRIIDEKMGPSTHSKALAIHGRTLEIFERMGIAKEFLAKGERVFGINYHHKEHSSHLAFEGNNSKYPFILFLPQSETETILYHTLQSLGGEVEWGCRLEDLTTLKKEEHLETIDYEWMIGADGAHSPIRHLLNIPFLGSAFPETFFLADIECESEFKANEPNLLMNPEGLLVFLPLGKKGFFRLIMPIEEPYDENQSSIEERIRSRGYHKTLSIRKIHWSSTFHIQRRQSVMMHKKKVFLTGDSAHVHSPLGGQGMNLSIQDSYNLAWKLAYVIQQKCVRSILNSYESERKPVAKKILSLTSFGTELLTFAKKASGTLFFIISLLAKSHFFKRKLSKALSGSWINYRKSSLSLSSRTEGPKAGDPIFDLPLEKGYFFDHLKSNDFILVLFKKNELFQKSIAEGFSAVVEQRVIEDRHLMESYHAGEDDYLLIRPDGYLASHGKTSDLLKLDRYLSKLFRPLLQQQL